VADDQLLLQDLENWNTFSIMGPRSTENAEQSFGGEEPDGRVAQTFLQFALRLPTECSPQSILDLVAAELPSPSVP
jgi:hypothetical protein